ncbi:MAG TPA: hypothetical protein VHY91_20885 [Pirellulales bacterium]|jgi:hypothetical protein|nr:hypothetical protein [Pirellulales bacterium]
MAATLSTSALADYHWLVSPAAEPYLASAAAEADPFARATRLRADLTPERARLVAEQVALRERGLKKFPDARRLFFTPVGLEQATDGWTAQYKAERFRAAGRVIDFCCGIGGDLMALAAIAPAHGVDRDPLAALFAEANCRVVAAGVLDRDRRAAVAVSVGEVGDTPLAANDFWHIDPDRRSAGRRTTHVELNDPPADAIDRLLSTASAGAVKLAPASELPERWREQAELEWISSARECRQLVAWFGPLARHPGRRRATMVPRGGASDLAAAPASIVGLPDVEHPIAAAVGRYVFDPDPAVVAARLVGSMAAELGLAALVAGGAYLTADPPIAHPLLTTLSVSEVMPWDVRRLKRLLRDRGIGRLEVKQRGTRHDPAAVQRELKVPGDAAATLVLFRRGKSVVAILAERAGRAPMS